MLMPQAAWITKQPRSQQPAGQRTRSSSEGGAKSCGEQEAQNHVVRSSMRTACTRGWVWCDDVWDLPTAGGFGALVLVAHGGAV